MSETKETRVHVEKADLPLESGESVNTFMSALREAVRTHLFKKLSLKVDRDKGLGADVWMMDVFGDQAIAEVNEYEPKKPSVGRFMAVTFRRKGNALALGDPVEVVRRVSYVPKAQVTANVAKSISEDTNSIWVGVGDEELAKALENQPVEKGFWAGVL